MASRSEEDPSKPGGIWSCPGNSGSSRNGPAVVSCLFCPLARGGPWPPVNAGAFRSGQPQPCVHWAPRASHVLTPPTWLAAWPRAWAVSGSAGTSLTIEGSRAAPRGGWAAPGGTQRGPDRDVRLPGSRSLPGSVPASRGLLTPRKSPVSLEEVRPVAGLPAIIARNGFRCHGLAKNKPGHLKEGLLLS